MRLPWTAACVVSGVSLWVIRVALFSDVLDPVVDGVICSDDESTETTSVTASVATVELASWGTGPVGMAIKIDGKSSRMITDVQPMLERIGVKPM